MFNRRGRCLIPSSESEPEAGRGERREREGGGAGVPGHSAVLVEARCGRRWQALNQVLGSGLLSGIVTRSAPG